MFTHIIQHEWRLIRSDKANWVLVGLIILFSSFALFNGLSWVRFQHQTITETAQEARETNARLQSSLRESIQTGKKFESHADPGSAATAGSRLRSAYAILPPAPLAPIAIGQSDIEPYYYRVTSFDRQSLIHGQEIQNPAILFQGHFDLAFFLIYLWPLFIIFFSYNIISIEKDNGTLPLLLAQPVGIKRLFLYKFMFRSGLGSLVICIFLTTLLMVGGINLVNPTVLESLGWFLFVVAAYTLFWFGLSFLVAGFNRKSSFNAMCLLGLWLFFVILIPGILNNLADTFYPVPSRLALINAQRQAVLHAAENGTNLVSKIYDEHPDFFAGKLDYSKTDREVNSYAVQIETEKIAIPFDKNFRLQTQNQQQFISQFQVFSPAIILQQQLNQLAGHGPARKASFENQTDKFHQQIKTYFRGKVFKKERLQPSDYEQMPQFMYQEISVNSGNNWSLLWAIGLAAAAFVLFTWMNLNKFKAVGSK